MNEVSNYAEPNAEMLLLGNKADDATNKVVPSEEAAVTQERKTNLPA